ncbi:MAG TPA: cytochrome P450 [Aliidongia sp.]|nr:cytochrome P450 [Aliidongia sp.]
MPAIVEKGPFTRPVYPTAPIVDLNNLDIYLDGPPHAAFKRMRHQAPIYWQDEHRTSWEPGYWAITRYADIVQISKNPQIFSSAKGINITLGDPEVMNPQVVNALIGGMIGTDAPQHMAYRRICVPSFTPKAIAGFEPRIRARVNELIDRVAADGHCDFVTALAELLPIWTLAELLGAPQRDLPRIIGWTNRLTGQGDPEFNPNAEGQQEVVKVFFDLFSYGRALLEERRRAPREDLCSIVANATIDGAELPPGALDGFFLLLVIAGNETTRNTISGGLWELTRNPDQYAKLRANPALLSNAVEEMLRMVSPVMHMRRTVTEDTELGGQKMRAGDKVVMWYGSANRDEDVFPDGDRFDIERKNASEHLAFGIGPHFCLGSRLGQVQIRIMFEELLRRLPDIRAIEPPQRMRSNFIAGIKHLEAAFTPVRPTA